MSEVGKNSSQSSNVLFWEHVYEKQLQKVEIILNKKCSYLKKLQSISFEQLDEKQVKQMQIIEDEIDVFVGCFAVIEDLRYAYVSSTAQNADLLIYLSCQNWSLKRTNAELQEKVKHLDDLTDTLLKVALKRGKEVQNVK